MYATPEEVIEAYEATGLVPVAGAACCKLDSKYAGCAIGALSLHRRGINCLSFDEDSDLDLSTLATCLYDVDIVKPHAFGLGFDDGFLGTDLWREEHPDYHAGHAAAVAVKQWWESKEASEATTELEEVLV